MRLKIEKGLRAVQGVLSGTDSDSRRYICTLDSIEYVIATWSKGFFSAIFGQYHAHIVLIPRKILHMIWLAERAIRGIEGGWGLGGPSKVE